MVKLNSGDCMKLYKILIPIIIVIILVLLFIKTNNKKTYTTTFKTLDTKVNITIYGINEEKVLDKIEKIYNEYNSLISIENNTNDNLYYIVYNEEDSNTITINKKLYQMIKFGKEWYKKSNSIIRL